MESPLPDWEKLYKACGHLLLSFARLEMCLSSSIRFNLGWRIDTRIYASPRNYAAVVLGSQRFRSSRDTAKRIVAHEGKLTPEQCAAMKAVFEQCGHIQDLRDKLAHQLVIPHPDDPDRWLVSDGFSTRDLGNEKTWALQTSAINRAGNDLHRAQDWFGEAHQSGTLFKFAPATAPAWRYTPTELKLLRPDTARKLRARLRPPQSSEE